MTPHATGLLLAGSRAAEPRTLVDILRASAEANPQASALADGDGSLSYRELIRLVNAAAARLSLAGVRRGDRVGIRIPSGTRTLYISILATLVAGASYVPVDADDPDERAELVFGEADVVGVIGADGAVVPRKRATVQQQERRDPPTSGIPTLGSPTGTLPVVNPPRPDDDAWVIFTSGSTGTPKGVAVTHRSAAAFVDAETRLFLPDDPIGPGDRVLAGLSVAFDASCEEMWLAWRNGACLVPAPRSLVRSGVDLGPWLIAHGITVVSTVPTLAGMWPVESLELVRLLAVGVRPGQYPVRSRIGWQVWATERLLDSARTVLFPFYASLFTPLWLRLLGAKVGRGVEASTVLLLPAMTTIGDHAFLADDTMIGSYELGHGWMRIDEAKIGRRAFLGNSGMTGPGRSVPKNGLVAVLSATPRKAKSGSSWLGNPPVRLRRAVAEFDESRTFRPPAGLKAARLLWELCRFVPVVVTAAIGLGVLVCLQWMIGAWGVGLAIVLSGVVLLAAGAVAAGATTVAKWLLVGRIAVREHPLWSSFVWRNEVSDAFVELVAAPWFAVAATGTPALAWWLRSLGARIGRGVWSESYWLPEADLITLGDGATVNRGCVVQTHLFHDRVMQLDTVELADGGTLGPHSVILPAAVIGAGASVGPVSLVMRGEVVPTSSRWAGNPIAPWKHEPWNTVAR